MSLALWHICDSLQKNVCLYEELYILAGSSIVVVGAGTNGYSSMFSFLTNQ